MDALAARVAGLPSGPALMTALNAAALPAPDKEALAGVVVAVLVDAAGGVFFFVFFFRVHQAAIGRGSRGRATPPTRPRQSALPTFSPGTAHRGRRCVYPNRNQRACAGPAFYRARARARPPSLDLSTSPPPPPPSLCILPAAGKENGGAPSPPATTAAAIAPAPAIVYDLAAADCVLPGLALTHPRATFDAAFFVADRLLVLSTGAKPPGAPAGAPAATRQLAIPAAAITSIAVIEDVPEDAGAVLMLLAARAGVGGAPLAWGKTPLTTLAVRLPAGAAADVGWGAGPAAPRLAGHTAVVLCQALGRLGVPAAAFDAPSPGVFRAAASTAGGGCAVGAAVGAHQGYVFPLGRGLAFVGRPPALVPLAGVWRAVLGRARGGGSASFDLVLIPSKKSAAAAAPAGAAGAGGAPPPPKKKAKPLEFSCLPKAELGAVQAWLGERGVGVILAGDEGAAAAGEEEEDEDDDDDGDGGGGGEAGAGEDDEGDGDGEGGSSEEDSDFVPGSPSSDGDRSDLTDEEEGGSGGGGDGGSGEEEGSESGSDDDSGSASLGSEGEGGSEEEGAGRAAKRARE